MNVRDIMTPDPACVRAQDTLDAAAKAMWDHDCGVVPVVGEADAVVGMITDRDICMAAWSRGVPIAEIPVRAVMSHDIAACTPDDDVQAAERLMQDRQVRRLPVVTADGRLRGIVSLADVARAATERRRGRSPAVTEDEVTRTLSAVSRPRADGHASA